MDGAVAGEGHSEDFMHFEGFDNQKLHGTVGMPRFSPQTMCDTVAEVRIIRFEGWEVLSFTMNWVSLKEGPERHCGKRGQQNQRHGQVAKQLRNSSLSRWRFASDVASSAGNSKLVGSSYHMSKVKTETIKTCAYRLFFHPKPTHGPKLHDLRTLK